ncbi:zf-TFIIB domain-containing protein [Microbacterium sp. bgisy207]|jgi:Zn-finger nucleic acid-binding protein|uniref:TFIIB-type zinc ribbon-containing protein n=1 Tax=Microbacterium sp. bgisy207 TaxID=3413800 RepID=UPI003EBA8D65
MKCPVDATDLLISERSGVEIDYCPRCRGVWLDRGELDKIIDRASGDPRTSGYDTRDYTHSRDRDDHRRDRDQHGRSGRRKREGFLGELFDF